MILIKHVKIQNKSFSLVSFQSLNSLSLSSTSEVILLLLLKQNFEVHPQPEEI
jgi:hypothetical protein